MLHYRYISGNKIICPWCPYWCFLGELSVCRGFWMDYSILYTIPLVWFISSSRMLNSKWRKCRYKDYTCTRRYQEIPERLRPVNWSNTHFCHEVETILTRDKYTNMTDILLTRTCNFCYALHTGYTCIILHVYTFILYNNEYMTNGTYVIHINKNISGPLYICLLNI